MKKVLQRAAGLLMSVLYALLDLPEDRRRPAAHFPCAAGERYCSSRGVR